MRTRCQYHCSGCHCHFTSLSAFDAHRRGEGKDRHCIDPMDDPVFALKTENGTCDARGKRSGVRLWWLSATAQTFDPANPSAFHGVSRVEGDPTDADGEHGERYAA